MSNVLSSYKIHISSNKMHDCWLLVEKLKILEKEIREKNFGHITKAL